MKKYFVILLLLITTSALFPLQWPVEKWVLQSTFGENRGNHYHTGIGIGGGEQKVLSVADGEIVYYQEENAFSSLPSELGNFIIIEHERELRTTYANLKKDSLEKNSIKVKSGDKIALIGDSGASSGPNLHFEVVDLELNEIVNPLMLLPPAGDRTKPSIKEVFIEMAGTKEEIKLLNRNNIKAGKYDFSAVIYDTSEYVDYFCQLAPYKINVYINGEEAAVISYNSIKKDDKSLVLSSNMKKVSDYYKNTLNSWHVYLGQFDISAGVVRVEIAASDFAGNEAAKEFLLISQK
ncbi:MAG: M23 family metallopeptidase [Spirochaetia bacterium]|nr:M23 family metallopeptidase [Spirochaetia bacterium]